MRLQLTLKCFVAKVNTNLLEGVGFKWFKAKSIQNTNRGDIIVTLVHPTSFTAKFSFNLNQLVRYRDKISEQRSIGDIDGGFRNLFRLNCGQFFQQPFAPCFKNDCDQYHLKRILGNTKQAQHRRLRSILIINKAFIIPVKFKLQVGSLKQCQNYGEYE